MNQRQRNNGIYAWLLLGVCLIWTLSFPLTPVMGQTAGNEGQNQDAAVGSGGDQSTEATIPQPEISPEAVEKAKEVLKKSAQAYHQASKMRDTITIVSPDPFTGLPAEQTVELEFYGGTDASVFIPGAGYHFFSVGKKVYATRKTVPLQYYETDLKGDLAQTVVDKAGPGIIFPDFAFKRTLDADYLEKVVTRTLKDAKITGYHRAVIEGEDIHELYALGSNGDLYIAIDPNTYFIKSYTVQIDPIPDPDPQKNFDGTVITFKFDSVVDDTLTPPDVSFVMNRDFVKKPSIAALDYDMITIGDPLPRVTSETIDGKTIRFCDDLSKINILVYFVMNDPMSDATLKMTQELEKRIKEENLPVKIICINTLEGMDDTPDEWRAQLKKFLADNNYDFTTVIDFDAMASNNHNIGYIPTFMIVDRDDVIRKKYDRQQATDADKMIKDIQRILDNEQKMKAAENAENLPAKSDSGG